MNTDSALVVTNNTRQTLESEKAYSVGGKFTLKQFRKFRV